VDISTTGACVDLGVEAVLKRGKRVFFGARRARIVRTEGTRIALNFKRAISLEGLQDARTDERLSITRDSFSMTAGRSEGPPRQLNAD
jgi:hypothetical protein